MNRPEPIELENNLGPDAVTGEINRVPWMAYDVDEMDLYIAEKDAEIAELKKKLMPCLNGDCILTCEVVEKYGKDNAELKAKLEDVQASMYCDVVDANMENRRLKRALWLARANSARNSYLKWNLFANFESEEKLFTIDEYDETPGATDGQVLRTYTEWMKTWNNVERKCREKAEQYK